MGGASEMKKQFVFESNQFVHCLLVVVVIAATLQSTTAGEPSSPLVANLTATPEARDFIQSTCSATCNDEVYIQYCSEFLAPYAMSINGSGTRAARAAVTVTVAELQALDKNVVEFNRTDGQDYTLGPCMKVIHEAAIGGKQKLAELDAAGDGNPAALEEVCTWYTDLGQKMSKCEPEIEDVPRHDVISNAIAALAGVVSAGHALIPPPE